MDGDSLPVSAFMDHVDGTVRARRCRLREARRCRRRSGMGRRRSASSATTAPMSARTPPSVPFALTDEEAKNAPAAAKIVASQGRQGQGCLSVHHGHLPAGLHGLRRLRRRLPRKGAGAQDGPAGNPAAISRTCSTTASRRSPRRRSCQTADGQGQPVPQAAA